MTAQEIKVVAHLPANHRTSCAEWDPVPSACDCGARPTPLVLLKDARAAIDAQAAEIERLTRERDAAFAMSRCECESNEARMDLVSNAEHASFYRWLRDALPEDWDALGVAEQGDIAGPGLRGEDLDTAIRAAMKGGE